MEQIRKKNRANQRKLEKRLTKDEDKGKSKRNRKRKRTDTKELQRRRCPLREELFNIDCYVNIGASPMVHPASFMGCSLVLLVFFPSTRHDDVVIFR